MFEPIRLPVSLSENAKTSPPVFQAKGCLSVSRRFFKSHTDLIDEIVAAEPMDGWMTIAGPQPGLYLYTDIGLDVHECGRVLEAEFCAPEFSLRVDLVNGVWCLTRYDLDFESASYSFAQMYFAPNPNTGRERVIYWIAMEGRSLGETRPVAQLFRGFEDGGANE